MYRYLGCGLPNVFLKNGYELIETPYGKGVKIHDLDGLHAALGGAIVDSPSAVSGHEFRFLRTEMNLSQASLAELLGCDEQSVARWEKGKSKQINAPAERLLRLLYKEAHHSGDHKLAPMLRSLQRMECTPPAPRQFVASERKANWSAKPQAIASA